MARLKIATLHCFGSNPAKHAKQQHHFRHCAEACGDLAEWVYPEGPNRIDEAVIRGLLRDDMGCTPEEVEAFGFEDPRCWFRFVDGRYAGLDTAMAYLADYCRRERPDGIAGYSNGAGAALLVAAAAEAGHEAFASIRFVISLAGPSSPTLQQHIRDLLGPAKSRIAMPALLLGSSRDPMLACAQQMAADLFEHCDLAITDEPRPFANHALPLEPEHYDPVVRFLAARQAEGLFRNEAKAGQLDIPA